MTAIVENIVDNYVEYGYGEKVDEYSIRSLYDDTVVVLEPEYDGAEIVSITVYSNDVEVDTLYYDDENFMMRLSTVLSEELNV